MMEYTESLLHVGSESPRRPSQTADDGIDEPTPAEFELVNRHTSADVLHPRRDSK